MKAHNKSLLISQGLRFRTYLSEHLQSAITKAACNAAGTTAVLRLWFKNRIFHKV